MDSTIQLIVNLVIPYAILLCSWAFIIKKAFNWRPFLFAKYVIQNSIKKESNTWQFRLCYVLWWAFFCIPYLAAIACGIYIGISTELKNIAIIIAIAPCALLTMLLLFKNYNHNGYKVGLSVKILLPTSLLLIFVLNIIITCMQNPKSWIAYGFLFIWPPLVFQAFVVCYSRVKIKAVAVEQMIESDEKKNQFINDMASNKFDNWLEGTGRVNIYLIIISIAISAVFNFVFYGVSKNQETLGTATGSFVLDVILYVRQYFVSSQTQTIILLFISYLLKSFTISLGPDYWLFGHSLFFAIFGTFFLIRFFHWLLIIVMCEVNDDLDDFSTSKPSVKPGRKAQTCPNPTKTPLTNEAGKPTNIDRFNKTLEKLKPEGRRPPTTEAISSIVGFALLVVAVSLESKMLIDERTSTLFGVAQTDIFVTICIFSIFLAMSVSALICSFNNNGKLTIPMIIMFISAIILDGLFFGLYDKLGFSSYNKGMIFMISFMVLSCLLLLILVIAKRFSFSRKSPNFKYIISIIALTVIDGICLVVVPLALHKSFLGLLMIFIIFTIVSFIVFLYYFNSPEAAKYWVLSGLATIIMYLCSGAILWKYLCGFYDKKESAKFTIIALTFILIIALYIFAFVWTRSNLWRFTIGPMLTTFFTSLVVLSGSIYLFYTSNSQQVFYSIISFTFSLVMFGSVIIYALQKNQWKQNWLSITSFVLFILVTLTILVLFCIRLSSIFYIYTTVSFVVAATCIIGTLGYTLMNSKTEVLVFSNLFFPVRRYVNGTIAKINSYSVMFILFVLVLWIWGLIGSSIGKMTNVCLFVMHGSWVIAFFLGIGLLMSLDQKALSSLKHISSETVKFALNKAMTGARINTQLIIPPKNRSTFEKFLRYEKAAHRMWGSRSVFLSSLKAQLYISAEMDFIQAKNRVKQYLTLNDIDSEFLDSSFFTLDERTYIISLWRQLGGTSTASIQDYENFVSKQENARSKSLLENINKSNETKTKYESLCSSLTRPFEDPEFHPRKSVPEPIKAILQGVTWERCENVFKGPFLANTKPDDMIQGSFGDCYLITSLNALSFNDTSNLFVKPDNGIKKGIACVRFKALGQDIYINVDTQIPFKNKKPKMVRPADTEKSPWWFTVVEKAFAKLSGSYSAVIGGSADVALYRLIGGWPKSYNFEDLGVREMIENGRLWDRMVRWNRNGDYMCCGSNKGSDTTKNKDGIIQGHAYAIHKVIETHGVQLLCLRNPWGDTEWTGDWSDASPLWERYPAIASDCRFKAADDGLFWINFNDFILNYASLYVCIKIGKGFYKTEIHDKLLTGASDGAKPVKDSPNADLLPQYSIRIRRGTHMMLTLERVGPDIPHWAYLVANNGEPVKKITAGSIYRTEAVPPNKCVHSFEWNIDESESAPWSLFVCRNKNNEESHYVLTIWSDKRIEVEPMINTAKGKIIR